MDMQAGKRVMGTGRIGLAKSDLTAGEREKERERTEKLSTRTSTRQDSCTSIYLSDQLCPSSFLCFYQVALHFAKCRVPLLYE